MSQNSEYSSQSSDDYYPSAQSTNNTEPWVCSQAESDSYYTSSQSTNNNEPWVLSQAESVDNYNSSQSSVHSYTSTQSYGSTIVLSSDSETSSNYSGSQYTQELSQSQHDSEKENQ
jgi:hypothetical protein